MVIVGCSGERNEFVDCSVSPISSATNRIIGADDHGSVQINVGHVNADGVYMGEFSTFAFCGMIRQMGESDAALNRLASEKSLMKNITGFTTSDKYDVAKK